MYSKIFHTLLMFPFACSVLYIQMMLVWKSTQQSNYVLLILEQRYFIALASTLVYVGIIF